MSPHSDTAAVSSYETHLSQLFFTSDRVFKLLKPVALPFVDFSDRVTRCEAATTEFECNQAIAPDVYLGLADVVEDGVLTDRMIIMRRLATEDGLTNLLDKPGLGERLHEVAKHIACLHTSRTPLTERTDNPASPVRVAKNWNDSFAVIEAHRGTVIPAEEFDEVHTLAHAYMAGRTDLFNSRIDDGWVRDGHGDLRAEHIYCTSDGPRIIDCLAFDNQLRMSDCLADIAFLGMDLDRLVGPEAAVNLMASWNEFTNEHHPSSLAHFYVAYRAHVRCKIACLRHEAGVAGAADEARIYHRLAARHVRLAQIRLVLVGGGPGTGKSTIAGHLAGHLGATWLRADEIRKDIGGIPHDRHAFAEPGEGIYAAEMTDRTYDELLRQARVLLSHGTSVVIDATWSSEARRKLARALGAQTKADVTELCTDVSPAVAKERIARRMASIHNPSDATPALVDYIGERFDSWPEAHRVNTSGPLQQARQQTLAIFSRPDDPLLQSPDRFSVNLTVLRDAFLVTAGIEGSIHV